MQPRRDPRERLEHMLACVDAPPLGDVTELLIDWVERRYIRAHDVEPSVALGAPGLRLGVNTSSPYGESELATRMSSALLTALGVVDGRVHEVVAQWVEQPRRELFVAFALEPRLRAKLYLRDLGPTDALAAMGERLLGAEVALEDAHTLCVDYVDGRAIGAKRYRYCEPGELPARAPALAAFLDDREVDPALVGALISERLDGSSSVLHAQLAGFADAAREDLGVAFARSVGAAEAPMLARWCASVPLVTRVIGVALDSIQLDSGADTVYLGMPHIIDP